MKTTILRKIGFLLLLSNLTGLLALAAVSFLVGFTETRSPRGILMTLSGACILNLGLLPLSLWFSRIYIIKPVIEQRRLEDQRRQSQKMEAVGNLCGGVAHDFNNILTIISGYAQLIAERHLDPDLRTGIDAIEQSAQRGAGLTRQLLAFSRKQILQPKILNLNRVVQEACGMAEKLIGERIEVDTQLASDLCRVSVDPVQTQLVLLNLAINASEAMPSGGTLTIKTENVLLKDISDVDLSGGQYVRLTVTDTGCGMDEVTKGRIFEPFFTTKARDRSPGLGLSTVYGIVQQSGGAISVESRPGKGTRFDIYFPTNLTLMPHRDSASIEGIGAGTETRSG